MQATSVPAPPAPPASPAPPAPRAPSASSAPAIVQTPIRPPIPQEYEALVAHRAELSRQFATVELQRDRLIDQLSDNPPATGAERTSLQQGIDALGVQMDLIQREIDETERLLDAPRTGVITTTEPARSWESPLNAGQTTAISIVFTLFVLFPLAIAAARLIWKRGSAARPALPEATSKRLERIEQAVDSIAIEVERISEGQRFVARLLDRPAGAEPVAIPREEGR